MRIDTKCKGTPGPTARNRYSFSFTRAFQHELSQRFFSSVVSSFLYEKFRRKECDYDKAFRYTGENGRQSAAFSASIARPDATGAFYGYVEGAPADS